MPKEKVTAETDWEVESGLPDDFDFWITRAEFGYLAEYTDQSGAQVPLLLWHGESPDVEIDSPIPWSLGKGWEPTKGGKSVRHVNGKEKFVATSMYGRLITRVTQELGVDMASRGSAKDASVWEGLGFHMKREEIEYKGLLQDKGGKTTRLMPVAFLGDKSEKKTVKKAAPAAAEKGQETTDTGEDALIKKLKLLAKTKDRMTFQSLALKMDEVNADEELLEQILDDSDDGFWARARKGE
ncbi:MAG: hypothetical protein ACP5LD_10480 [Desulfomonilaceae bacterium]